MTTYYLSTLVGQVPSKANVSEATSSPTADVIVTIGSGAVGATLMSRAYVVNALQACINWLLTDDPNRAGSGTIPLIQ